MQAERDYIRKYVLPRLQEELLKKNIIVKIIDLRWGISEDDKVEDGGFESKVLHVCSDAIKQSKPYFLALIGGRYGWIPSKELMNIAKESLSEHECDILSEEGISITEMEILLGALGTTELIDHSFFCLRNDDVYPTINDENKSIYIDNEDNSRRLQSLKEKIHITCELNDKMSHIIPYSCCWDDNAHCMTSLQKFGDDLYEALYKDIEAYASDPEEQVSEYQLILDSFVLSKISGFHGRTAILEDLSKHLLEYDMWAPGVTNGLFLVGDSGSGKSSVLCKLYDELINKVDSRTIVLAYCQGISNEITMMDYWTEVIALRCDLDKTCHINTLFTQATLLGYKFVILIDSLDTFDKNLRESAYKFIPDYIPFVCTTQAHAVSQLRKTSKYRFIDLNRFDLEEASLMIDATMKYNLKELNTDIKGLIMSHKNEYGDFSCTSPFWLKMVLSIINELGSKDFEIIYNHASKGMTTDQYLANTISDMPGDIARLFYYFIDITTRYFNPDFVKSSLAYIATSRYGIKECVLEEILGNLWNPLEWQSLRYWLKDYIRYNPTNDSWSVTHNILKNVLTNIKADICHEIKERYKDIIEQHLSSEQECEDYLLMLVKDKDYHRMHRVQFPNILALLEKGLVSAKEFIDIAVGYAKIYGLFADQNKENGVLSQFKYLYSGYTYRNRDVGFDRYEVGSMLFEGLGRELLDEGYVNSGNPEAFNAYIHVYRQHLDVLSAKNDTGEMAAVLRRMMKCFKINKNLYGSSIVTELALMESLNEYWDQVASEDTSLYKDSAHELNWITSFADEELMGYAFNCIEELWYKILKTRLLTTEEKLKINLQFQDAMIRVNDPGWEYYVKMVKSLLNHYEEQTGLNASDTSLAKFFEASYAELLHRRQARLEADTKTVNTQVNDKPDEEQSEYYHEDYNYFKESFVYRNELMRGILELAAQINPSNESEWVSFIRLILDISTNLLSKDKDQSLNLVKACVTIAHDHIQYHLQGELDEYNLSYGYGVALEMIADWYQEHHPSHRLHFLERIYSKMIVAHFIVPTSEMLNTVFDLLKKEYEMSGDRERVLNMHLLKFEMNTLYPHFAWAELRGLWNFISSLSQEEQSRVRRKEEFRVKFDRYADNSKGDHERKWPLSEDRAVTRRPYGKNHSIWGFTDSNNQDATEFKFSFLSMLNEDRAPYAPLLDMSMRRYHCWGFPGCKYGYIDKDGNEIIPAQYDYASLFYESEGLVAQRNELFFIDAQGNFIRKLLKNNFFKTIR